MTTELVLLMGLYAFILFGVFMGDAGPIQAFSDSGPRLAARVERNVAVGTGFRDALKESGLSWQLGQ